MRILVLVFSISKNNGLIYEKNYLDQMSFSPLKWEK